MNKVTISIVIPAFNEEGKIKATITQIVTALAQMEGTWEIVVVDDGSTDGTVSIVTEQANGDERIRLLPMPHRGKGAAVKTGIFETTGEYILVTDADLSVAPHEIDRFMQVFKSRASVSSARLGILIASREVQGSVRIGEPIWRHLIGKAFNLWVKLLVGSKFDDTQCGFKLFSRGAAQPIFERVSIQGFGFDAEMLYLAHLLQFEIGELGVEWRHSSDSRVGFISGIGGFVDVARIFSRRVTGRYRRR